MDESPSFTDAIQAALARPFVDEVKQYDAGKAGMLSYIDARAVQNRLDEVVGVGNWFDDYRVVDQATCVVQCWLTVFGVTKSDVGYPNDPGDADKAFKEPMKAAVSDALKRAAVKFGIGRHLYSTENNRRGTQRPAASHQDREPRPLREPSNIPKASPDKPATANQIATIAKLSRLTGDPEPAYETMSAADASTAITELARKYNARPTQKQG